MIKKKLVIEGYPRSANTFAVIAFQHAQKNQVNLAHHLHATSQIKYAARNGIPIIVLIRDPKDAITSLVVRYPQANIEGCLKEYINFYKSIYGYRNKFIVTDFKEVVSDFGSAINRLNKKLNTQFDVFNHNEENINAVFKEIDRVHLYYNEDQNQLARPAKVKEPLKKSVLNRFNDIKYQNKLNQAYYWYNKYMNEVNLDIDFYKTAIES